MTARSEVIAALRRFPTLTRVQLRDVRPLLRASRGEQDEALKVLQREGAIVLYRNDNTPAVTAEDKAAALYVGDSPRHLVYVEQLPANGGGVSGEKAFDRALEAEERANPPGALLLVSRVRRRAGLSKEAFDAEALRRAKAGGVVLHHHDHAASLSAAARAELVAGRRGVFYSGMARAGEVATSTKARKPMARREREPKFWLYYYDGDWKTRDRYGVHGHGSTGHSTKAAALKGLRGLLSKLKPLAKEAHLRLEERGRFGTYQLAEYRAEPKGSGWTWVGGPRSEAAKGAPVLANSEPPHAVQRAETRNEYGTVWGPVRRFATEAEAREVVRRELGKAPKLVGARLDWKERVRGADGQATEKLVASYDAIERKGRKVWDFVRGSERFLPEATPTRWTQKKRESGGSMAGKRKHFRITLVPQARGNLVDLRVNGKKVDSEPAGGAVVGRFRGLVRDLREANPGATFSLPGGLASEMDLIRDASALYSGRGGTMAKKKTRGSKGGKGGKLLGSKRLPSPFQLRGMVSGIGNDMDAMRLLRQALELETATGRVPWQTLFGSWNGSSESWLSALGKLQRAGYVDRVERGEWIYLGHDKIASQRVPGPLVTSTKAVGPYEKGERIQVGSKDGTLWASPVGAGEKSNGWYLYSPQGLEIAVYKRNGGWLAADVGSLATGGPRIGARAVSIRKVAEGSTAARAAQNYADWSPRMIGRRPPGGWGPEKGSAVKKKTKKKKAKKKASKRTPAQLERLAAIRGDLKALRRRQKAARKKAVSVCRAERQRVRAKVKKFREEERARINREVDAMRKKARENCASRKAKIAASTASATKKARARLEAEKALQRKLAGINDRAKKKRAQVTQAYK